MAVTGVMADRWQNAGPIQAKLGVQRKGRVVRSGRVGAEVEAAAETPTWSVCRVCAAGRRRLAEKAARLVAIQATGSSWTEAVGVAGSRSSPPATFSSPARDTWGTGRVRFMERFVNTGLFPDGLPRVYTFAEWVAMSSEEYILLAGAGGGGAGGDGQMVESEGARSRGGRSAASPAPSSGPKTPSPTPVLRIAAQEVTALLDLSASLDTSPYRQVRPSTLPAPSDSLVSVEPSSLDLLTARLDSGWDPVARAIADFTQAPTAPLDSLFGEELLLPQLLRGSF